jgi:acyl carrier protein
MEQNQVFEKVIGLITPYAKNKEALANVGLETRILEDLSVNSARLVDIILAFEDEFNISIDDGAADKVRTVGDAVSLIALKTS